MMLTRQVFTATASSPPDGAMPRQCALFYSVTFWPEDVVMSQHPGTTDREYATVNVSEEFRDKLRVEKAKRGLSYEELIRENLTLDFDEATD